MTEVSICGVGGRFPESCNVDEFWANLMSGTDMVTEDNCRWETGLWGLPKRSGKLRDLDKFDAPFFEVHAKQANEMDPQLRILLEVSFEAILDAGVNPDTLAGKRIGVWVGSGAPETQGVSGNDPETTEGYGLIGCSPSMFANRISYFYDFKGPSMTVDTACSSSLLGLHMACQSIRNGHCDGAIVGGSNLTLKPHTTLQFDRLNMLAPDGACKSFDKSANGIARSEAVAAIYVTRKNISQWAYCDVINTKTNNDGRKREGITFPSGKQQGILMKETCEECGIQPRDLDYFEAHGTGTNVGDPQELNAIDDVMCSDRGSPLLIGSVKSNMGHSEAASGVCGVIKCAMALRLKTIPPNLHYNEPNPAVDGLLENRLKVVTKKTPLPPNALVGVNSFGFGGSNVHVILKSVTSSGDRYVTETKKPIFKLMTARNEDGIKAKLENTSFPTLNNVVDISTSLHPFRGYVINMNNDVTSNTVSEYAKVGKKKEVWYILPGMGTQWKDMGKELLNIRVFSDAINRCTEALSNYGFNVRDLMLDANEETYTNTINAFVGLVALQIGLIDILSSLGVIPAGIIGHSLGELACGYADGCLSLEQTIKAAYVRGVCVKEQKLTLGAMAVVGMTWQECLDQCPAGVAPACSNSLNSVTVSGTKNDVTNFVTSLREKGVFVRELNSGGIAFHSEYIRPVRSRFVGELKKLIPKPQTRSQRWISTSSSSNDNVTRDDYDVEVLRCSAEYYGNNLVNPVMFYDALREIPEDATTVEIAPHCHLQAILKRSLPESCDRVFLTNKSEPCQVQTLLDGVGQLHCLGFDLKTSGISDSLAEPRGYSSHGEAWNHESSWKVIASQAFMTSLEDEQRLSAKIRLVFSADSSDNYLRGHVIDGRSFLPATAHLRFAWQTLAKHLQLPPDEVAVQFDDVTIHRATALPDEGVVEILVQLIPSANEFRISEGGAIVSSGRVKVFEGEIARVSARVDNDWMTKKEIYKWFGLAGYNYKGDFQALDRAEQRGQAGQILFDGNYITFLDAIFQMSILGTHDHKLNMPTRILRLQIRPRVDLTNVGVEVNKARQTVTADGVVELKGLQVTNVQRRKQTPQPVLESQVFVPNRQLNISESDSKVQRYSRSLTHYINSNMHTLKQRISALSCDLLSASYDDGEGIAHEDLEGNLYELLKSIVEFRTDSGQLTPSELRAMLEQAHLFGDPLLNYCVAKCAPIKSLIDIVIENSRKYVNIVELLQYDSGIKQDLADVVRSHFESLSRIQYDYGVENIDDTFDVETADLVIINNLSSKGMENAQIILSNITKTMRNGFILLNENCLETEYQFIVNSIRKSIDSNYERVYESKNEILRLVSTNGFEIVSERHDELFGNSVYLLRWQTKEEQMYPDCKLVEIKYDEFSWIENIKESLRNRMCRLWLIGRERENGIMGMFRSLRMEPGGEKLRCIFNTSHELDFPAELSEVFSKDLAVNVYKNGEWGTFRHIAFEKRKKTISNRSYVMSLTKGELSSFEWVNSVPKVMKGHQEYRVAYSALNNRDVMRAKGKLPPESMPGNTDEFYSLPGLEFSGYNSSNKNVMGLLPGAGLATHVTARPEFVWEVPDDWSLSDASTVPVAYCTAYYALLVRGKLRKGETILIHSGAGDVGQAAIAIALWLSCRVFTTVSSARQGEHLMRRFPQLSGESFASCRDTAFEGHLMEMTGGKGFDIVLNNLPDDKFEASLRCLAEHGRFLEMLDLIQNSNPEGITIFRRDFSFHGISLDALFNENSSDWSETVGHLTQGIREGVVRPLAAKIFQKNELELALSYSDQAKLIGKILIQVENENNMANTVERTACDPNLSYVITGGLGGFGLELSDWLIRRGARHIVITTRSGVKTAYQNRYVEYWRAKNVEVTISNSDVTSIEGARDVLDSSVGGIFHLAMVLQDGLFENQSAATFKNVCSVKCDGVLNLDRASRQMCARLRWFVAFSSAASGRGNAGQANYAFANSFVERVCEARRDDGFPALAIQWGAVGDVGVAMETFAGDVIGGTAPQTMASCLETLDVFLCQSSDTVVSSMVPAPNKSAQSSGRKKTLSQVVANVLGIQDFDMVDKDATFENLGVDSLMAAEISQQIEQAVGITVATNDVHTLTFGNLEQFCSVEK